MTAWGMKKTAPPQSTAKQTVPPDCDPDTAVRAAARPGRSGSSRDPAPASRAPHRTARRSSDQRFVPRLRWPFAQRLLSLAAARRQLAKAVDRGVAAQKAVQHVGEKIYASAYELPLVKLDLHTRAARRQVAINRLHNGKVRARLHLHDSRDLVFEIGRVSEVVQPQDLLERQYALLGERKIIERELRNQPPQLALYPWRIVAGRGPAQRRDLLDRRIILRTEISVLQSEGQPRGQVE